MPFELTYWSKPYLAVTGKSTATYETAAEAWRAYERLTASDETVEIAHDGHRVG
jgi:hypothetical protein